MPELPEVDALRADLTPRLQGRAVVTTYLTAISALKTFRPPLESLSGQFVTGVARHGKFLDVDVSGTHLVVHLARAGWLRWHDQVPTTPPRPGGKNPLALRVVLDDGSGFDLTEAGTRKGLAVHLVTDPADVPGVATLGPDPLTDDFTPEVLRGILETAGRTQVKGVLRSQSVIAGIGNAYSDEILHVARLSPFAPASTVLADDPDALHDAVRDTLLSAVERARGVGAAGLKQEKKAGMRVHGRAGQACPVCGDTVAEVSFADSALQYCPTCQTGGKPLADRRMSRLLR